MRRRFRTAASLAVHKSPGDYPSGKAGDVLTVEFTVLGQHFLGLNGGPEFTFDEAISFQVFTDTQEETDRYWNAIVGGGGQESVCGWCKDKFGLSWQIAPRALIEAMNDPDTRRRQARVGRDDDDEEDRHRQDRGGTIGEKVIEEMIGSRNGPCDSGSTARRSRDPDGHLQPLHRPFGDHVRSSSAHRGRASSLVRRSRRLGTVSAAGGH